MRVIDRRPKPRRNALTRADIVPQEPVKIFPCPHRGAVLDWTATCHCCGHRGEQVEVYACEVHGVCSPTLKAKSADHPVTIKFCKTCEVFRASEAGLGQP